MRSGFKDFEQVLGANSAQRIEALQVISLSVKELNEAKSEWSKAYPGVELNLSFIAHFRVEMQLREKSFRLTFGHWMWIAKRLVNLAVLVIYDARPN